MLMKADTDCSASHCAGYLPPQAQALPDDPFELAVCDIKANQRPLAHSLYTSTSSCKCLHSS